MNIMKASEKIASNIIRKIVVREEMGWPPVCWGVFYQPERPVRKGGVHGLDRDCKDDTNTNR